MDARQCMIVDLKKHGDKQMFVTERVSSIYKNPNGLWAVRFSSSPRVFNYNPSRLLYLTNPETIDIGQKGLYINNRHITNVAGLLRFTKGCYTFYRVIYSNGYCDNLEAREVYITRTPIDENGSSTWDYLKKLAAETGLTAEDDESILSKQYDLVDVKRDNVPLAQYLGDKSKLAIYCMPPHLYYPFGCNASQKTAVEAALPHQVSIIQGPPGTGKTQTILNIIANLLLAGKTVLVVSNNNSAIDNVTEIVEAISDLKQINTGVICHYPLSRLINDWSLLNDEEKAFAKSPFSHVDFLIYNSLTKQPLKTIEVDGWRFHQSCDVQQSRDALKDRLLTKYGLCPFRISTTETVDMETIKQLISNN